MTQRIAQSSQRIAVVIITNDISDEFLCQVENKNLHRGAQRSTESHREDSIINAFKSSIGYNTLYIFPSLRYRSGKHCSREEQVHYFRQM